MTDLDRAGLEAASSALARSRQPYDVEACIAAYLAVAGSPTDERPGVSHAVCSWTYVAPDRAVEALLHIRRLVKEANGWPLGDENLPAATPDPPREEWRVVDGDNVVCRLAGHRDFGTFRPWAEEQCRGLVERFPGESFRIERRVGDEEWEAWCPPDTPMGSCVPRCGDARCEAAAGRAAAHPDPPDGQLSYRVRDRDSDYKAMCHEDREHAELLLQAWLADGRDAVVERRHVFDGGWLPVGRPFFTGQQERMLDRCEAFDAANPDPETDT